LGQTIPPSVHLPLVRFDETPTVMPTATATESPTPTMTASPTPTEVMVTPTDTPSPTPTNTPMPTATATATQGPSEACLCDWNRYNCSDFGSQAAAQACFNFCVSQGAGDVHLLDQDEDGVACESLPLGWSLYEDGS
jgi:hypothetical protein